MRRVNGGDRNTESSEILSCGDLRLDPQRRSARRGDLELDLTAVQFDILHGFMAHPGRVFTRTDILEFFQDHAWEGYERTIDVHIRAVRRALGDAADVIETVRGVGYRFRDPGAG